MLGFPDIARTTYLPALSYTILAVFLGLAFARYALRAFSKEGHYPPGPKPHLFVGHTFQVPASRTWIYFEELGKKFGPIVRLSLAGDEVLILNKAEDAEELLGKKSLNYSSRNTPVFAGKYQSQGRRLLLMPYGEELKKQRAAFHHMLQPRAVRSYDDLIELEASDLLLHALSNPTDTELNMTRYSASVIYTLAYGKRMGDDDGDLRDIIHVLEGFVRECYPGAHLVDTFRTLDKLPDFLSPWRSAALKNHEIEMQLYGRLVLEVKDKIDRLGENLPECFASRLWQSNADLNLDMKTIAYVCGTAFEAGTDTTAGTLLFFLVAMLHYPEALKKAQDEIDRVVGSDGSTMPGFSHMNNLPYCFALTKEVFRWRPAAPGGFPHLSEDEDIYKGYKIKGKTMVIPNIWAMQHDEEKFPDPSQFKPERFLADKPTDLTSSGLTEGHYAFGFGRRNCPGKYLAAKSNWLAMTRLMWAFIITHELDSHGKPIPVDHYSSTSGITVKPLPFAVRLQPRSDRHADTIKSEWEKVSQLFK